MNTPQDDRKTLRFNSKLEGDSSLLDGKEPIIEVSYPTAAVPNLVRFETASYVLKIKLTKTSLAKWKSVLETSASLLKVIDEKEVKEIPAFSIKYTKKDGYFIELLDSVVTLKHVSPGWFKTEDELVTFDFFSV